MQWAFSATGLGTAGPGCVTSLAGAPPARFGQYGKFRRRRSALLPSWCVSHAGRSPTPCAHACNAVLCLEMDVHPSTLAANVMHFAHLLRRAGLPVGPAETIAAQQALTLVDSATGPKRAPHCAPR